MISEPPNGEENSFEHRAARPVAGSARLQRARPPAPPGGSASNVDGLQDRHPRGCGGICGASDRTHPPGKPLRHRLRQPRPGRSRDVPTLHLHQASAEALLRDMPALAPATRLRQTARPVRQGRLVHAIPESRRFHHPRQPHAARRAVRLPRGEGASRPRGLRTSTS